MPWKNFPEWMNHVPDWLHWIAGFFAMLGAVGLGAMAKIADDVKTGHRDQFWTMALFLEVPALVMMALVSWGVAVHYDLNSGAAAVLGTSLGWLGPKTIEALVTARVMKIWRK